MSLYEILYKKYNLCVIILLRDVRTLILSYYLVFLLLLQFVLKAVYVPSFSVTDFDLLFFLTVKDQDTRRTPGLIC